jgi:PEP-CTERM motif
MQFKLRAVVGAGLVSAVSLVFTGAASAGVVYSNGPAGDSFTNAGPVGAGQAVGSSGWVYNNVRNGGTVGIDGSLARSGNGSAHMSGNAGPADPSSKADIEYYGNGTGLGLFSQLTSMSYDWYRSGSSTANAALQPSLRVLIDRDGDLGTTGDQGALVFERTYNNLATPTDTWVSDTITAATILWNNGGIGLGDPFFTNDLSDWQALFPRAEIIGFSSGIGSGWGPFDGAVDNIAWTIDGVTTTSNFEVQAAAVPEPASLALVGVALAGLGLARRKNRKG